MIFIQILFRFWMCFQPNVIQLFQDLIFGIKISCVNVDYPALTAAFQLTTGTIVNMQRIDDISGVYIVGQLFEDESVQLIEVFASDIDISPRFIMLTQENDFFFQAVELITTSDQP